MKYVIDDNDINTSDRCYVFFQKVDRLSKLACSLDFGQLEALSQLIVGWFKNKELDQEFIQVILLFYFKAVNPWMPQKRNNVTKQYCEKHIDADLLLHINMREMPAADFSLLNFYHYTIYQGLMFFNMITYPKTYKIACSLLPLSLLFGRRVEVAKGQLWAVLTFQPYSGRQAGFGL